MSEALPSLDLRPDHMDIVRGILRRHVPDRKVLVFGSRATWTAKDYSDLDLAVLGDEPLPLNVSSALAESFVESDLPFKVDVVDWASASESFRQVIEKDYVVLVEKEERSWVDEWQNTSIRDCTVINDATYSPKEAWPFVNYLDTGNITENRISEIQHLIVGKDRIPSRARRKVMPGDIVYSTVRPNQKHFGLLKEVPENFLASTGFSVIRGKDDFAYTNFIYWFLAQEHIVEELHTIAEHSTSAYPSIRPSDIEGLSFNLPPLPEQRAIAHVLGTLDDKIELNRRMNETLEAMARALFKSWFVDFDPVRAKMEGRDTGLPKHVADLFPDRMVDSELGKIPRGWKVGCIGDIANSPRRSVNPMDLPDETPYIGLDHMPRQSVSLMEWGNAANITSNKSIFEKSDILFGKLRPYFHKVGIAPVGGICSTDIVVVTQKTTEWFVFLLACLSSTEFVNYTDQTSTGTKMPRTSWKIMVSYRLCLPPPSVLQIFQNITLPLVEHIIANIHECRTLVTLRDTLLPKLVSGKLRLKSDTFHRLKAYV